VAQLYSPRKPASACTQSATIPKPGPLLALARDLKKFCDEEARGVSDLPIDRIAQAVQPTPVQRNALDDLKDASIKAAEELKVGCPTYQTLTPTGRVEAMEKTAGRDPRRGEDLSGASREILQFAE
jgi:hypothetical protein